VYDKVRERERETETEGEETERQRNRRGTERERERERGGRERERERRERETQLKIQTFRKLQQFLFPQQFQNFLTVLVPVHRFSVIVIERDSESRINFL
jgi:hypothetical protein